MVVEIHILSGSRQGERVELDRREFRVGSDPGCEVFFDPHQDPPAKDRSAQFQLVENGGWTIRSLGAGQLLVNHEPVESTAHIRSGDVVRLSEFGPDFTFNILTKLTLPPPVDTAPVENVPPGTAPPDAVGAQQPATPAPGTEEPVPATPTAQPSRPAAGGGLAVAILAGGLVALCLLLALVLGWQLIAARPDGAGVASQADTSQGATSEETTTGATTTGGSTTGATTTGSTTAGGTTTDGTTSEDAAAVLKKTQEAVFLLEAVHPSGQASWPVANACAIRGETLLTTGTAAVDLASLKGMKFEEEEWKDKKWSLRVRNPLSGFQREVKEIRVHRAFNELAGEPAKRIYFDLALVTVDKGLPQTLSLAPAKELSEGLPVTDVAVPYEIELVTSLQSYVAQTTKGKVFMRSLLDPELAGSPGLLHVKIPIPVPQSDTGPFVKGSPLVDASGLLVGVYSAPAAGRGQALKIHYVVETRLAGLWLEGKGADSWVSPAVSEKPPAPPAESKPSGNQ